MSRIAKLRQKPKHVRNNIAFVAAGVCTLPVLAYMVFAVHGPKVSSGLTESDINQPKFFETLTGQIKEQVAAAREATATSTARAGTPTTTSNTVRSVVADPATTTASSGRTVLIATTSAATSSAVVY